MTEPNILFIMCDQLRWDYLSCYGHPHLETPNIDRLAEQGVRFDRAYVQSPICGPSRACFYTGRYMSSHGVEWNFHPLSVGQTTLGEYLEPQGLRTLLVGKTHVIPDGEGMARLGIDPSSEIGIRVAQGGFEPFERDDGIHPDGVLRQRPELRYNDYLRDKGYQNENPWDRNANGALDEAPRKRGEDNFVSGWYLRHNNRPANIAEEHSETPYMTTRAIECIEELGDEPWCIHLSYIKPHWPYIVPAPYHDMYGEEHILPTNCAESELNDPNPVYEAFTQIRGSRNFSRPEVRSAVIPAYMGLIKQIDDQIGRLLDWLEDNDYMKNTMIVFTSDHGDYLGDHWLGEKDLFHEESVRIPLIIYDPSPEADKTRGTVQRRFTESIDLVPTFLELTGGKAQPHKLEGRSLLPLLHGKPVETWREYVISETGYSGREARQLLGLEPSECRGYMIRNERWKYILWEGFEPQLFDLHHDPNELEDLGRSPQHESIRHNLHKQLFTWLRKRQMRTTISEEQAATLSPAWEDSVGVLIGYWSEEEGPFL